MTAETRQYLDMSPRSSRSTTEASSVGLLHSLHANRHSPPGPAAHSPHEPRRPARPDDPPAHPADIAQSRLFQSILVDELDELHDLIATAERRWKRLREANPDAPVVVPHALLRLRERLREAGRLLGALNERFPPD